MQDWILQNRDWLINWSMLYLVLFPVGLYFTLLCWESWRGKDPNALGRTLAAPVSGCLRLFGYRYWIPILLFPDTAWGKRSYIFLASWFWPVRLLWYCVTCPLFTLPFMLLARRKPIWQ